MLSGIRRITACAILLLLSAATAYAQPDTVTTTTGEKIVGEIKKVEKDIVTIETPYSDSDFKIKRDQVVAIDSARQFMVETFDGPRLSGSLTSDVAKKTLQVGAVTVTLAEITFSIARDRYTPLPNSALNFDGMVSRFLASRVCS